jgi:hypothetical protein
VPTEETLAEENADKDKDTPLVERWLKEQQAWQKTVMSYMDSMVKNDDFLVHLGNAMRGSLLAGKPYPTQASAAAAPADAPAAVSDEKLDEILYALRQLEGQVQDLRLSLDELKAAAPQRPALLDPTAGQTGKKAVSGRRKGPVNAGDDE